MEHVDAEQGARETVHACSSSSRWRSATGASSPALARFVPPYGKFGGRRVAYLDSERDLGVTIEIFGGDRSVQEAAARGT
jgi:hypothetical protein